VPTRISIVATPDAMVSPVAGLFETLDYVPGVAVEIVGERAGPVDGASGLTITAHRSISDVAATDVVIVPSMSMDADGSSPCGRYPRVVAWIRDMHGGGATICSACTGAMLTAETGLLDGEEATVHWLSEAVFRRRHPRVRLRIEEALVVSGGGRLVTSGASTAWHDLALYLVARYVGPASAQELARIQLFRWHHDGQGAFHVFAPPLDHGDAAVVAAQRWVEDGFASIDAVERMASSSGLSARTFKRRFKAATGWAPIAYVQRVRVERAKRLLETTRDPIEDISWAVGYQDTASFRRLFKRITGLTPGEYRVRFRLPDVAAVSAPGPGERRPLRSRRSGTGPTPGHTRRAGH
jgi:transcriptional regulator GlxA family with amidase domain